MQSKQRGLVLPADAGGGANLVHLQCDCLVGRQWVGARDFFRWREARHSGKGQVLAEVVGEATGEAALFIIVDHSDVWVELDIFLRDLTLIKKGQSVLLETLDGKDQITASIDWVSPLTAHASQSVRARVVVANKEGVLRPGQFIRGHVTIAEHEFALAVRQSAFQRFRDFQVVFAHFGDTYEVRMLELGRSNHEWVEVLSGIDPGTQYVTKNSYLIKADIEKSGASHDH